MEKTKASQTKKEKLELLLHKLIESAGIDGAAVIRRDGIPIASNMHKSIDVGTFAAMSATMAGAAETAVNELGKSVPDRIIVESKDVRLLTVSAGKDTLLACMTRPESKLGLVLIEMKDTAKSIEKVMIGGDKKD